ncbi:hypothetical protein GLAREA_02823 [Glarea lozoyensis ATCC 20868]|uniref:Uncharacterized protein n=1 Tax=Glarea lozoyensis (strain ATCC 20868 / MF5171) TaxID=1116229 RepID=S3CP20_GLAL2|nr:uncharacterized protein GLAREA_02823 [Glarea lozoyensis ATCC 20868]EPE26909.1 hypothetical protein GLAREA_02823 [Glarea lozoyensis ATCC 20868]
MGGIGGPRTGGVMSNKTREKYNSDVKTIQKQWQVLTNLEDVFPVAIRPERELSVIDVHNLSSISKTTTLDEARALFVAECQTSSGPRPIQPADLVNIDTCLNTRQISPDDSNIVVITDESSDEAGNANEKPNQGAAGNINTTRKQTNDRRELPEKGSVPNGMEKSLKVNPRSQQPTTTLNSKKRDLANSEIAKIGLNTGNSAMNEKSSSGASGLIVRPFGKYKTSKAPPKASSDMRACPPPSRTSPPPLSVTGAQSQPFLNNNGNTTDRCIGSNKGKRKLGEKDNQPRRAKASPYESATSQVGNNNHDTANSERMARLAEHVERIMDTVGDVASVIEKGSNEKLKNELMLVIAATAKYFRGDVESIMKKA